MSQLGRQPDLTRQLDGFVQNLHGFVDQLDRTLRDRVETEQEGNDDESETSDLDGFIVGDDEVDESSPEESQVTEETSSEDDRDLQSISSQLPTQPLPPRRLRNRNARNRARTPVVESSSSDSEIEETPPVHVIQTRSHDSPRTSVTPRRRDAVSQTPPSRRRRRSRTEVTPTRAPLVVMNPDEPSTSRGTTSRVRPPVLTLSDSGSEPNIRSRPKRRRIVDVQSQDEEDSASSMQPVAGSTTGTDAAGTSGGHVASTGGSIADDEEEEDGCTICYEDFANAGDHRLVSLKCGHFFGKSCIERWIRSEGRAASCPTCKTKTVTKDVRLHFAKAVKLSDTSELESLRVSNVALNRRIAELEMDIARKDRELAEARTRASNAGPQQAVPTARVRAGRIILAPRQKIDLSSNGNSPQSRAFDFNGDYFAVGIQSPGSSMFLPYAVRRVDWLNSEFKNGAYVPLHANRSRVVVFSPFESNLVLSGGEDKRAIVHAVGGGQNIRKQWKIPGDRQVWAGCWTRNDKVVIGTNNGRVWEYDVESDSTEPIRDFTGGVGVMPIIFVAYEHTSNVLLVSSFKKMMAFRDDRVYPLLSSADDSFDSIRGVCWDESSLSFMVTFAPGGRHPCISHRLYKLEVDQENHEVRCVEVATWQTACVRSSTLWSNCLFSTDQGLFSVVFNEDLRRLDCHDWSGRRSDVVLKFSSANNVCAMLAMPGSIPGEKTIAVLTEKALYSVSFRTLEA